MNFFDLICKWKASRRFNPEKYLLMVLLIENIFYFSILSIFSLDLMIILDLMLDSILFDVLRIFKYGMMRLIVCNLILSDLKIYALSC